MVPMSFIHTCGIPIPSPHTCVCCLTSINPAKAVHVRTISEVISYLRRTTVDVWMDTTYTKLVPRIRETSCVIRWTRIR